MPPATTEVSEVWYHFLAKYFSDDARGFLKLLIKMLCRASFLFYRVVILYFLHLARPWDVFFFVRLCSESVPG